MQFPRIQPNGFHRLMQRIAMTRIGTAMFIPTAHHLDRFMLALSGGRYTTIGLLSGMPVVNVTMVGAKSGVKRTLPLTGLPDGNCLLLMASNWGQTNHPAWYYNLRANPQVTITYRGESGDYRVCDLEGAERERAYRMFDDAYAGYKLYRQRAAPRQIHVYQLIPIK